ARGDGGLHGCRPARGVPRGELSNDEQHADAADQVVEIEPWQLILDGEPISDAEREHAAGEDAARGDERVLHEEVSEDIRTAGPDGAAGANLLESARHGECRKAEDAESGEADQN